MPISLLLPPDIDARLTVGSGTPEEDLYLMIGTAGAIMRSSIMERYDESVLASLLSRQFVRICHVGGWEIVALSDEGRTFYWEVAGHRPDYVQRPKSVADRAFQVAALWHLRHRYKVIGRQVKASPGLPRGQTSGLPHTRQGTDQVLAYHVIRHKRPSDEQTVARAADGEVTLEALRRTPLLYCPGADGAVGMDYIRALMRRHKGDVVRWGHPVIVAVPELTPELQLGLEALQHRQRDDYRGTPRAPRLGSADVPLVVEVPVISAANVPA